MALPIELSHDVRSELEPYAAPTYAPQLGMPRALTAQPLLSVGEAAFELEVGPATASISAMASDRKRATDRGLLCGVRMVSFRGRVQDGPHSEKPVRRQ